jgi:putative metallohydrolase (TIGR04338 family)
MRPRDSQRSKLYAAEAILQGAPDFKTVQECQAFADSVMANRWVRARWNRYIEVRPGKGHTRATGSHSSGIIQLPLWSRQRLVVLHEVAHVLTPGNYAHHGPEYAGVLLSLVHHVLGAEQAAKLRVSYREHRVRYNLKGVPSSPRYTVPTQASVAAKQRERNTRPLSSDEKVAMAAMLRRGAKAGQFGPSGRKPRANALALARLLEVAP